MLVSDVAVLPKSIPGVRSPGMSLDIFGLGQTATGVTKLPGNRIDNNSGIFGDEFKNCYRTTNLFGLGAVVPTLPTHASLYDRPTPTIFSGLGQATTPPVTQRPLVDLVEKLAQVSTVGGVALWFASPKTNKIGAIMASIGLGVMAARKLHEFIAMARS